MLPQTIGDTRFGIVLGAGIEYMIAPILTAKLEYNYDDFGRRTTISIRSPGRCRSTTGSASRAVQRS